MDIKDGKNKNHIKNKPKVINLGCRLNFLNPKSSKISWFQKR